MPIWRSRVDDWFRTHHGVISLPQLRLLGCSSSTVHRMVARGELIVLLPGVFRSAQWPESEVQWLVAACARNPLAAVAFTTACRQWGYRRVDDQRLHLLVPHGSTPLMEPFVLHRCRRIDAVDIVERPDGIRLTSPPRTLFDSADLLGLAASRSVLEQILNEQLCTIDTVIDTFVRLGHPNRPGTHTMRAALGARPKWRRALQSDLEFRVLDAIERAGLPVPVAQCPVQLLDGRIIHLDFGWPEWRVGLEIDDPAWHDGVQERHNDMGRDRKAAVVGWHVLRASKIDVDGALGDAVDDVSSVIRRRRLAA